MLAILVFADEFADVFARRTVAAGRDLLVHEGLEGLG